jgi:hypothetical protein
MSTKDCSPRQAAQKLGVRMDVVYALIWCGKLAAKKVDGKWLISLSAVERRLRNKLESTAQIHASTRFQSKVAAELHGQRSR